MNDYFDEEDRGVEDISIPLYMLAEKVYNRLKNYDQAHKTLVEQFGVPPEWSHLALERFKNESL